MKDQHLINVLVSCLIIILEAINLRRRAGSVSVSVAAITYVAHVLFFYLVVLQKFDISLHNEWSSALRLHGLLTILLQTVYRFIFCSDGCKNG